MPNLTRAVLHGILLYIFIFATGVHGAGIEKVDPPYWYDCYADDTLMLLIYGEGLENMAFDGAGRELRYLRTEQSGHGKFLRIWFRVRKAGECLIRFRDIKKGEVLDLSYEIRAADKYAAEPMGPSDVMYLIMPDRFSDGDTTNNNIAGHPDNIARDHQWGRHGGDLQGILNNIEYLEELGVSALWLTPIYENRYQYAYHGYTPSDLYRVEGHLGDMKLYGELIEKLHGAGIKIIQDHIVNHISPSHPIAVSPPDSSWINGSPADFHACDYQIPNVSGAWVSDAVREYTQGGWFAGYLPDMNMANAEVQRYYIQHTLWWIQKMGLDGIRQDTWPYSDQDGMKHWAAGIKREYPGLYLLAEVWVDDPVVLSYFFSDSPRLVSDITSITDFPLTASLKGMLLGHKSLRAFYNQLNRDFLYKDPNALLLFTDNHDLGRFASERGIDMDKYLNAYTIIYALRGLPMLYYGNEIMMPGGHDPDNRREFPGGFADHARNAFTADGRSDDENIVFEHIRALNELRRANPGLFRAEMQLEMAGDSLLLLSRSDGARHLVMAYNHANRASELSNSHFSMSEHSDYRTFFGKKAIKIGDKMPLIPGKKAILYISEP